MPHLDEPARRRIARYAFVCGALILATFILLGIAIWWDDYPV
jgi:hypothetical protein